MKAAVDTHLTDLETVLIQQALRKRDITMFHMNESWQDETCMVVRP